MTKHTQAEYDAAQTELGDRLAEHLLSIAVLTIEARKLSPDSDKLADVLDDIARDIACAQSINDRLNSGRF